MTDLDPAPTIREKKWDDALRLMDYLNRKWAYAMGHGEDEIGLKFPTQLVLLMHDALQHMIDHQMPLYRLHVDAEEYSRSMLAAAATAEQTMKDICLRATATIAEFEAALNRRKPK